MPASFCARNDNFRERVSASLLKLSVRHRPLARGFCIRHCESPSEGEHPSDHDESSDRNPRRVGGCAGQRNRRRESSETPSTFGQVALTFHHSLLDIDSAAEKSPVLPIDPWRRSAPGEPPPRAKG